MTDADELMECVHRTFDRNAVLHLSWRMGSCGITLVRAGETLRYFEGKTFDEAAKLLRHSLAGEVSNRAFLSRRAQADHEKAAANAREKAEAHEALARELEPTTDD